MIKLNNMDTLHNSLNQQTASLGQTAVRGFTKEENLRRAIDFVTPVIKVLIKTFTLILYKGAYLLIIHKMRFNRSGVPKVGFSP